MIPVARIREVLRYANTTNVAEALNMLPPSGVVLSAEEVAQVREALMAARTDDPSVWWPQAGAALALLDGAEEEEK